MVQNKKEEVLDILKSRFDVLKILIKRANLFYDSLDKGELFQYQVDKEEIAELKPCIEWLESLQEQPQIEYEKYEFCKDIMVVELNEYFQHHTAAGTNLYLQQFLNQD